MTSKSALVIFLHGIGGSGSQMLPIAASWRTALDHVRFAAPDAPFANAYGGHQWFGVDGRELHPERIAKVRDAFDQVIEREVERAGIDTDLDRVAFVGVSQGAIVALDAVESGRWQVGALVSIAGLLPPVPISAKATATSVCLIHGADDRTIPSTETEAAAARLSRAGVRVETHIIPGVPHTVSQEELAIALRFLRQNLR